MTTAFGCMEVKTTALERERNLQRLIVNILEGIFEERNATLSLYVGTKPEGEEEKDKFHRDVWGGFYKHRAQVREVHQELEMRFMRTSGMTDSQKARSSKEGQLSPAAVHCHASAPQCAD